MLNHARQLQGAGSEDMSGVRNSDVYIVVSLQSYSGLNVMTIVFLTFSHTYSLRVFIVLGFQHYAYKQIFYF